jgi:iron only hydrogenase large subunit-like protein
MVVQTAPAVRVAIAETLGLAPGEVTAGQLVSGLRMLGFDYVFGERRPWAGDWGRDWGWG